MTEGVITNLREGFGFIKIEGQEKDLFFHANELVDVQFDSLRVGDKLQFEIGDSPKGKNAVNVHKI
ncbi:MAG TPA: cold shock domain-containing protein [Candidatus Paceibacterota bacterium]|nr:cold shock domain-containing protein [Candidatus Paceibacterota bacterium]